MRFCLPGLLTFLLLANPVLAQNKKKSAASKAPPAAAPAAPAPDEAAPPTAPPAAAGDPVPKADSPGPDGKPVVKNKDLDSLLDEAKSDEERERERIEAERVKKKADEAAAKAQREKAEKDAKALLEKKKAAPKGPVVVPLTPSGPDTTDNADTEEAAAPVALKAVEKTTEPRRRGPYEIGHLDCRLLDGAGIERVLPKEIVSGEEPDILCRIIITQPGNVLTAEHDLTLSVIVGAKETFKQSRKIRMSAIGRRSVVFLIASDRIASDVDAEVKINAVLSAPANPPGGRQVRFTNKLID